MRLTIRLKRAIFQMAIFVISITNPALGNDNFILKRMILDAQAENLDKFREGSMHAIVTKIIKGRGTAKMDSKIRWDTSARHWEFRLSDPDGLFRNKKHYNLPLQEAPVEHFLMTKDHLVSTNSILNTVDIQKPFAPGSPYGGYEFFEITPNPLWNICCLPYAIGGRPWKELLDKPLVSPSPGDEIRFDQLGDGIIRLSVLSPKNAYSATYDFSLDMAGNLIRYASQKKGEPKRSKVINNKWVKEGNLVMLVNSKMHMGGEDDLSAIQTIDIQIDSMRPATGKVPMTLEKIVQRMPKNTRVFDQVKNKSYPVDPRATETVSNIQLQKIADELKNGVFLKP